MEDPNKFKQIEEDETIQKVTNNKLSIDDFIIESVIGRGSYGKVFLVRRKGEDEIFAMKVLKKKHMIKRNQIEHIKTERKVMELISHPFIVNFIYAFQNTQKLYFVMEYCPGGEMFFHIQRKDKFNEPTLFLKKS